MRKSEMDAAAAAFRSGIAIASGDERCRLRALQADKAESSSR